MKKFGSTLLAAGGAVLASATFYDASLLTQALGLPVEGNEAVVALASLSVSAVLLLFAIRGLYKHTIDSTSQRAA